MSIKVQSDDQDLKAVIGDYEHQPHCGTAFTSLYKKSTDVNDIYMFLNPDSISRPEHNNFVFSYDYTQKHYGESRSSLGRVHASWRPWHIVDGRVHAISTTIPDVWAPATMTLASASMPLSVDFLEEGRLVNNVLPNCSRALTCLHVLLPNELSVQTFADHSWALESAKTLPVCSSWQTVQSEWLAECSCAPVYPNILWSVNEKGVATAHEDRRAASTFERAIKQRPAIIQLESSSDASGTRIRIGVNIMSLAHRARGRLSKRNPITTSWRLITDHVDLPPQPFPKFRLQSTANDDHDSPITPPHYLWGAQRRSVSWMARQELGRSITICEIEESIHSSLGWRAEARVETDQLVRGGMLADQPSFGKTVASIGLIQSEFEEVTSEELIKRNQSLTAEQSRRLDSAATLVVCPPHIAQQWNKELKTFLDSEYEAYKVKVIENYSQLLGLTIEDLLQSKVIVVSWTIFAEEAYVSEMARFTAMPAPIMTSRRAFSCWLDKVVDEIPSRLAVWESHDYGSFEQLTEELLQERLKHPEFQASLPISIQHGSAYQSFSAMLPSSGRSKSAKAKTKTQTKPKRNSSSHLAPLLHLFRFNRIIVDEYHYLNDTNRMESNLIATSIKRVAAVKRWVLSGTPALANFSDVNQLASFLDLKLGRNFCGDSTIMTSAEKTSRLDQTDVESFLSRTEVMSRQWHEARHQRAQKFLDVFVRQNEAELQHIDCSGRLVAVDLDAAHHAVYLELSQYLISQKMQIKKLNKKSGSDKSSRLNESLESSASAEEALLRCALLFKTEEGRSALDDLIKKRSDQLQSTKQKLLRQLSEFEDLTKNKTLHADSGIKDLYGHFKKDVTQSNWLGDHESSETVREILSRAQKTTKATFAKLKSTSKAQQERMIKQQLSQLRDVSLELAHRTRSNRFVISIRDHLQPVDLGKTQLLRCSSPSCEGTADLGLLFSIPHCGHTACKECLDSRVDDETCVHPGCNSRVSEGNLIRIADLGSSKGQNAGQSFGNKLEAIVQLVCGMPASDQGIVFAPNEEIIDILETVFDLYEIPYHSPRQGQSNATKIMENFRDDKDPMTRKKLIILNFGSELAAGINLPIANHVIFVSPLLTKTQYEYESAMAQAVARSRRYGQTKKVHIHHVIAQRTIDVDILEHRHRRNDVITTLDSITGLGKLSSTKVEKTKLVRNNKGEMMLVPHTWLADESKRRIMGVEKSDETFTSLINFSETFEQEDDEA